MIDVSFQTGKSPFDLPTSCLSSHVLEDFYFCIEVTDLCLCDTTAAVRLYSRPGICVLFKEMTAVFSDICLCLGGRIVTRQQDELKYLFTRPYQILSGSDERTSAKVRP